MMLPGPEAQQLATFLAGRCMASAAESARVALHPPRDIHPLALSLIYVEYGSVPIVGGGLLRTHPGDHRHRLQCDDQAGAQKLCVIRCTA